MVEKKRAGMSEFLLIFFILFIYLFFFFFLGGEGEYKATPE